MFAKIYILFDLVHANKAQVVKTLKGKSGVSMVEALEGPPDVIMVIDASHRQRAAEYFMNILDSIGGMIENLRMIPVIELSEKKSHTNLGRSQTVRGRFREEIAEYV